jgi:hypothetical protein
MLSMSSPRNVIRQQNVFDVSRPYATLMRLALAMAVLPGLGTGLLLVVVAGFSLPLAIPWPQLAQVHGQIQALGFVLLFICAVGLQLFPRFLGAPVQHAERATWGAVAISLALLARLATQPMTAGPLRAAGLAVAGIVLPLGALLAGFAFHGLSRRSVQPSRGPSAAWRRFVAVGGTALGAALVLYVWSSVLLVKGDLMVAQGLDEALTHLELIGFSACIVFAVASRIFGRFLLLRTRPGLEARLPLLALGWGVGLALVASGWLVDPRWGVWVRFLGSVIELGVLVSWLWLIGLYDQPSRASGTPHITVPTRRWVRCAFAFLAVGVVLNTIAYGREALEGVAPTIAVLSAARHAVAQGFLLPLMVSMAARLLPIYSADVLKHRRQLELIVDLLLVGALLRVGAEAVGGYGQPTGAIVALGGTLTLVGFIWFAAGLWSSLARLPALRLTTA